MSATYDSIATGTVTGSPNQEIVFNSIPNTFTDLVVMVSGASAGSSVSDITWRANGDTANNYAFVRILAEAPGLYSDGSGSANQVNCNQTGTESSVTWLQINNYSNSGVYKASHLKTIAGWSSGPTMAVGAGTWKSNSVITSLTIRNEQQTFDVGTKATLFGIKAK